MLQPFAVESHDFHLYAQKRSPSTSQCKMCISWLTILWQTAGIGYLLWATWAWHLWPLKIDC